MEWGFGRDFRDVNNGGRDVRSEQLAGSFGLDMRPSRACHAIMSVTE